MMLAGVRGSKRPNFIVMIADDLGYGDVGLFGNKTIPTPNIDWIGTQGAKLTHSLAAASLCTPSRAAILTGRYPIRYGMTSSSANRVHLFVAQSGGLPLSEITFPKILQQNGYRTALIGKWHLGNDRNRRHDQEHHPNRHGFDYFYGLPLTNLKDFGLTGESVVISFFPNFYRFLISLTVTGLSAAFLFSRMGVSRLVLISLILVSVGVPSFLLLFQRSIPTLNSILMRNDQVIEQPVRIEGTTGRFVEESKNFMSNAVRSGEPFMLMLSFLKVHTIHRPSPRFRGQSQHGPFGDCVMELDWGVGEILKHVLADKRMSNTMIVFTSDNGGHLEDVSASGQATGGYNGVLRGGKGHGAKEGGIRVPTVIYWPPFIPAGYEIKVPVSLMDLFPTIVQAAGQTVPKNLDGQSLMPLFEKRSQSEGERFIFHYCGSYLHGVTYFQDIQHIWKVYFFSPKYKNSREDKCHYMCTCYGAGVVRHEPPQLFNLVNDLSETHDSSLSESRVLDQVEVAVQKHRQSIEHVEESQFDIWHSTWRPDLQPCCNFPFCSCSESEVEFI